MDCLGGTFGMAGIHECGVERDGKWRRLGRKRIVRVLEEGGGHNHLKQNKQKINPEINFVGWRSTKPQPGPTLSFISILKKEIFDKSSINTPLKPAWGG